MFGSIREHRELVKRLIWTNLKPSLHLRVMQAPAPVVAVHIRRGDFRELQPGEDFRKVGGARTPLEYFISTIEQNSGLPWNRSSRDGLHRWICIRNPVRDYFTSRADRNSKYTNSRSTSDVESRPDCNVGRQYLRVLGRFSCRCSCNLASPPYLCPSSSEVDQRAVL